MTARYLADTQIILWNWHEREKLPARYLRILASDALVYANVVSIWEIPIKTGLGKLHRAETRRSNPFSTPPSPRSVRPYADRAGDERELADADRGQQFSLYDLTIV